MKPRRIIYIETDGDVSLETVASSPKYKSLARIVQRQRAILIPPRINSGHCRAFGAKQVREGR